MTTTPDTVNRRKLIEVSIPLEEINAACAREKSIRHGHPSTLHLWWSRKPLAATRAVLFAQLVDDPSSDESLTEEQQKTERERLHEMIRQLVKWENISNESLLRAAHEEILKSAGGNLPAILDPFAGSGAIPLEAQRLGLEVHASDLNPVAVLINKALIEIPSKFAGQQPVFPGSVDSKIGAWPGATGLREDVRRYGAWMRQEAYARTKYLYPDVTIVDEKTRKETRATTIAWIWARTVVCSNPGCAIRLPLVNSWWLGKKKGKESYVVPSIVEDPEAPGGRRVEFSIGHDPVTAPKPGDDGTAAGGNGRCVACGSVSQAAYIRAEGRAGRIGDQLMAVVAQGVRSRVYLAPTPCQTEAALVAPPASVPTGSLPKAALGFRVQGYGYSEWSQLFTNRQLTTLTVLCDLVTITRERVLADARLVETQRGLALAEHATGAEAYADAVATYLGLAVSRFLDRHSRITTWDSGPKKEYERSAFAGPKLQMSSGYVESNPFGNAGADISASLAWVERALGGVPIGIVGDIAQADAAARSYVDYVVSTDPPYYNNVGYAALSDLFYVWLRRSLRGVYPELFSSILAPKAEELVAEPARHGGVGGAEQFFESGFRKVFANARLSAPPAYPMTVYYAFKQQELSTEGITSTGWASVLDGMIRSGWAITATWPIRSEMPNRLRSIGSNALASSIVLVLRPRPHTAVQATRRGFVNALKHALPAALDRMRESAIAPVDLTQATIGPGMAVFSSYSRVVDNDGSDMSIKAAIALINQAVDDALDEQLGEVDADTRFCVKWYEQYGWSKGPFGVAEQLAVRYDTSVRGVADSSVLTQSQGVVKLVAPNDLPSSWNPFRYHRTSVWEVMCHLGRVLLADDGGLAQAAELMAAVARRPEIDLGSVQRVAYRMYEMTKASRVDDARLFNLVGGSWTDLTDAAGRAQGPGAVQAAFDFEDEN
ncbi:protein of unknown function DUF1156 [Gordonia polyisoprenivorans VH2]|uniref:DUF1156 domain-containing protein n=1 Tax=Gordonia polyisoprenivorans (strain DSM 44266 / VH2) TaxID=1112204 RepID=H6MR99_GORPV|nr:DUF1156 domain-containing protein [Gordonia polyisoprenivorans]AFA71244.1 protein of unknown function DUF1156 [Gordonia polyisoprenivorans VH2]